MRAELAKPLGGMFVGVSEHATVAEGMQELIAVAHQRMDRVFDSALQQVTPTATAAAAALASDRQEMQRALGLSHSPVPGLAQWRKARQTLASTLAGPVRTQAAPAP